MAWHPHKNMLAMAHKDNCVYVYELEGSVWMCKLLKHRFMVDITCLEWKQRAGGILAVGCRQHEADTTAQTSTLISSKIAKQAAPQYHPNAWMNYYRYPGHEHISAVAWDPTPGSFLIAAASAITNTLVIYDTLLQRTKPLKRYGKGNVLLRWSPDGEWLYSASISGYSRMWETRTWTSSQFLNPPGLWVQSACWAPDNRSLFYSMRGKSDVYMLYRTGETLKSDQLDWKLLSTASKPITTASGETITTGGVIKEMSLDPTGQRLAIAYETSELVSLYAVNLTSPMILDKKNVLSLHGYIRGSELQLLSETEIKLKPLTNVRPHHVAYAGSCSNGALLAIVYENNVVSFVRHSYISESESRRRLYI
ncbi:hypothetical protein DFQ28_008620 [Apophysomyces sp. BC1034]|nr:hypothetical protein DFQ30_008440 [Apophysomyces sp. BC1015]KAG0169973.1 hypothetical protein DFQ29_009488 [Apophysomyces sp. BC1021]KAG0185895.1 hypothetical protein DFQ28_008620 [Apophysomyces sp. BC1034]